MWRAALVLSVVALSSGCLDVCARAKLQSEQFQKRHAACFPTDALVNAPFDPKACQASMDPCSQSDEQALQRYFDCLDQLPVCTTETKSTFTQAMLACASGMNELSPGCFRQ